MNLCVKCHQPVYLVVCRDGVVRPVSHFGTLWCRVHLLPRRSR